MKSLRVWRALLYGLAVAVCAGGLRFWAVAGLSIEAGPPENSIALAEAGRPATGDSLPVLAMRVIQGNPFRVQRRPTSVRFSGTLTPPSATPEEPPFSSRPALSLGGIVGGPPWAILIEGVPGHERGFLANLGDDVNGINVRKIVGDTALVSAFDTTYTLVLRRVW